MKNHEQRTKKQLCYAINQLKNLYYHRSTSITERLKPKTLNLMTMKPLIKILLCLLLLNGQNLMDSKNTNEIIRININISLSEKITIHLN